MNELSHSGHVWGMWKKSLSRSSRSFPLLGKYIWAGLGAILCSMLTAQQRSLFLCTSSPTRGKQSCALLWLNCNKTLLQGVRVCRTLRREILLAPLGSSNVQQNVTSKHRTGHRQQKNTRGFGKAHIVQLNKRKLNCISLSKWFLFHFHNPQICMD